jgi:hypothetical protein
MWETSRKPVTNDHDLFLAAPYNRLIVQNLHLQRALTVRH